MCHDVAMCGTISSAIGIGSVFTSATIASTCCLQTLSETSNQNNERKLACNSSQNEKNELKSPNPA
jgi:hypothetical protein